MEIDTAAFICRVVIGLALIVKVVLGLIQNKRSIYLHDGHQNHSARRG